jgi:putative hydrolase of the HAD superfamily
MCHSCAGGNPENLKTMIKYIIFDWGGVCSYAHALKDFARDFATKTGKDEDEIERVFRELEYPYETGRITPAQFWTDLRQRLGVDMPIKEIQAVMLHSCDLSNKEVLDLILELKNKFKIVLLSNNYEDLFAHTKQFYNFDKYFDLTFSSSNIGFKKPEPEAYEHVLKTLGAKPEEVVFIDNKEKNIIGASNLGIKTVHFKDVEQLKKELSQYL